MAGGWVVGAIAAAWVGAAAAGPPGSPVVAPAAATGPEAGARLLVEGFASGDWEAVAERAGRQLDAAARARGEDAGPIIDAGYAWRLATLLSEAGKESRARAEPILREHESLARAVAFAVQPEDDADAVLHVLADLHARFGAQVNEYAALATAIAVVHDRSESEKPWSPGRLPAPAPAQVFAYLAACEGQSPFGIKGLPAEMLVYVVDFQASEGEMRWALQEYAGRREIGRVFFEVPYDYGFLKLGGQRRVAEHGYTLRNLKRYGGICADQAYFATNVARATGTPGVYVYAEGGEMSHAWVGYLERHPTKGTLRWNFDFGRYEEYRGVAGEIVDPQTGRVVADGVLSLSAQVFATPTPRRRLAASLVGAAERRLRAADGRSDEATVEALALLEEGLRNCPAYTPGWRVGGELAAAGRLTADEKARWAEALLELCGEDSPDFVVDVLDPIVRSVSDARKQDQLWGRIAQRVRERNDLVARVLTRQAELALAQRDGARARDLYATIVTRFANDGPFIVEALEAWSQVLVAAGRRGEMLQFYRDAWKQVDTPGQVTPDRMRRSNWYRVGEALAERLAAAGLHGEARKVRQRLDSVVRG